MILLYKSPSILTEGRKRSTPNFRVSVIIPTYKRGHLIKHILDSLKNQTYKNFEVIIIVKPSGDQTVAVIEQYKNCLSVSVVWQQKGNCLDAINIGIEHANGEIIVCGDDDSIPYPDWIENHVKAYRDPKIGGVAGDVLPVSMGESRFVSTPSQRSEIIPANFSAWNRPSLPWNQPIKGLENFFVYISRAGLVEYNCLVSFYARHRRVASLLGMGTNMSFLAEAVRDFRFPDSWVLGLSNEQYLAWHLWREGYRLVFDPAIKVSHINHGESMSRSIRQRKRDLLRWIDYNLLFYRLYGDERGISIMYRVVWLIFDSIVNIKKFCMDKESSQLARLKSKVYSELIGLKWLLYKKLDLEYSPTSDLNKLIGIF
ncbi:MAG: glycosyltransferase family 2 protein [Candidatus Jordarchaeaceae archaeon]